MLWHALIKRGGVTRKDGSKRGAEEALWFDVVGVIRARIPDVIIGIKFFGIYMDEYGNQCVSVRVGQAASHYSHFSLEFHT